MAGGRYYVPVPEMSDDEPVVCIPRWCHIGVLLVSLAIAAACLTVVYCTFC